MLTIIDVNQGEEWDTIVKGFKNYDVYYLLNYVKAFKIHGDGMPILLYYSGGGMKAVNVVMKRDIALDKKFLGSIPEGKHYDYITPYGYGGFLIEGDINKENIENLNHEYKLFCNENGVVSEFVRFHPILKNHIGLDSIYEIVNLGKTVSIDLESEDYIWCNLTSKNRNVIRKAEKNQVKIYWGRSLELITKFIEMYNQTMDKDKADEYYYFSEDFYSSIIDDLKYNFLIFYAMYKGKIIAMSIIMFSNKIMHYHLSASKIEYLTYAPTNLLIYEAARWGVRNGYKVFHLGGGLGSKEDNLYKFKKAFNRTGYNEYFIGKKIFNQKVYDKLAEIRKKEAIFDENTFFFPSYRG